MKDEIKEFEEEIDSYNKMLEETDILEEMDEKKELDDEIENYNNMIDDSKENTRVFNNKEIYEEIEDEEKKETRINTNKEKYDEEEDFLGEKKNKNKKKIIIIVIIIILILLILGIIGYYLYNNKEKEIKNKKEEVYTEKKMKKILNNYGEALENVIGINLEKKDKLLTFKEADELVDFDENIICKINEIYKDGKIFLDKCTINKHKTKASYGKIKKEEAEIIEDGSFYVYVKDDIGTLEEPKNKDDYKIYKITTGTKPSEIELLTKYKPKYVSYADEEYNMHLKNIKTDKDAVLLNGITSVIPIYNDNINGYDTTYVGIRKNDKAGIYNLNTGLTETKIIYDTLQPNLNYGITGPETRITSLNATNIAVRYNNKAGVINYKTGEEVIPCTYDTMLRSGDYLFAYNYNDKIINKTIYDLDGNKYLENKYDELYGIVDGKYILVKDKEEIKLVQIDGKILYNYGKIKNLGEMYYFISYNNEPLFQFENTNDNKCIEVSYDTSSKKGNYKNIECGGIAKPILYMYPEKEEQVKITFDHPELLNTTYPKYKKEWNVTVYEDSKIIDKNNKEYYALYWDEKLVNKVKFNKGFYVTKENAIEFLEEKLYEIGLTNRESNEFIMYWLPILEKNKKNLVYFELTEERDKYNKINIDPKPDSILRMAIHIKKVNKKVKIKEQKLPHFERNGFTVVEWGGTNY